MYDFLALRVVSATNIRNAARAWPNLVLIALLPGQPDIGTSGKGAARDEVSDGDDEVEEVDQDGEEHSAEGASEDEEDVDENDEIGAAQPKKVRIPAMFIFLAFSLTLTLHSYSALDQAMFPATPMTSKPRQIHPNRHPLLKVAPPSLTMMHQTQ